MTSTPTATYQPETAAQFFTELEAAWRYRPDYRRVYSLYNNVFQRCLNGLTEHRRLTLAGYFAKMDYVLKERQAPQTLYAQLNDTRVRLRHRLELPAEELATYAAADLRTLCQFLSFLEPDVHVPSALQRAFPSEPVAEPTRTLLTECMRVLVESWDDDIVEATVAEGGARRVRVCYSSGNRLYPFDWTYLRRLFAPGVQLNLVRPREEEGVLYPELIIYEPDYLVDISAVAHCFTNYAESALVHLLHKIEPAAASSQIVLGNFAGQLLDEQIHPAASERSYAESVTRFWQHNAVGMLTVDLDATFHDEARRQQRNIARALEEALPQDVRSFNVRDCMVEPSFFSEMLGLQGRMDFLQLDYKILLEQKSGKGAFPYDDFQKPRFREEHYVQMLLYMLLIRYNFRPVYEQNRRELHAFLLYSKYRDSLLGLSFSPELIFRALKVRNAIAWTEMRFAATDGFRLLERLTPDAVNLKHDASSLWGNYQRPQIAALLAPIGEATPLERAYYFRFLTFIAQEHVLSKLGNKTKESSGFAAKWYDSLEDKLQAGNIYDRLTLLSPAADHEGSVETVRLRFSETASQNMSNFRPGDIVILYAYQPDREPDVRRNMAFRCTIARIDLDTITLALRAAQSDARVFLREKGKCWAIEHDFMEASYSSLYRGMHAFLSAPKERRDLLLLQRPPRVDRSLRLNGDYGPFNDLVLAGKQARDCFLIIGPPGTGKTSYGMLYALREELTEPGSTVLLLSYTNRAVDEICSKLEEDGIDYLRLGSPLSCSAESQGKLLGEVAAGSPNLASLKRRLGEVRVVAATTTAMSANVALFRLKTFSLAIIDEASQILEPHLMGILSACHGRGVSAVGRFLMIGDHKQLPAVVQQTPEVSEVTEPELRAVLLTDCRLSLFERLLKRYREDPQVVYMLTHQGRMHRDIAEFPNRAFYGGRLDVVPLDHQLQPLPAVGTSQNGIDNLLTTRRIAFLHVESPAETLSDKVNTAEAEVIAATVLRIHHLHRATFDPDKTVGVIVPYRNQIATVRNLLDRSGIPALHDITIDTVERYQGSQRAYIIYGFTIQKYYQLNFLTNNVFEDWDGSIIDRKLNVAMTRAREHLIMVGNAALLQHNVTFDRLLDFVRERKGWLSVPVAQYVAGDFRLEE